MQILRRKFKDHSISITKHTIFILLTKKLASLLLGRTRSTNKWNYHKESDVSVSIFCILLLWLCTFVFHTFENFTIWEFADNTCFTYRYPLGSAAISSRRSVHWSWDRFYHLSYFAYTHSSSITINIVMLCTMAFEAYVF